MNIGISYICYWQPGLCHHMTGRRPMLSCCPLVRCHHLGRRLLVKCHPVLLAELGAWCMQSRTCLLSREGRLKDWIKSRGSSSSNIAISRRFFCVYQNQAHQPYLLIVRPMLMMVGRKRRAPLMMFGGWGSVRSDYNCPAQSESTQPSSPRMRRVPSNQILAPDPPQRRHHLPYPALIWAPSSSTSGATCPQWTFYLALQPIHIPSMST